MKLSKTIARCNGVGFDVNDYKTVVCDRRDSCLRYLSLDSADKDYGTYILPELDREKSGCPEYISE